MLKKLWFKVLPKIISKFLSTLLCLEGICKIIILKITMGFQIHIFLLNINQTKYYFKTSSRKKEHLT